jgi:hypothetical protein
VHDLHGFRNRAYGIEDPPRDAAVRIAHQGRDDAGALARKIGE